MKIVAIHKYKTKLFKFKLLKTKIHKSKKNFDYLLLKDTEARFKKILSIIYKFHAANKKILFIGTPLELNSQIKQLLKDKKHSFLPESVWMNGIITNSNSSFKHLIKQHALNTNKISKLLFNLKSQIDLIVVLNEKLNITALEESSLKRVPTISINTTYNFLNLNLSTYKVLGNYNFGKKKVRNNLFFLLLNSLLKKAELIRKKQIKLKTERSKHKILMNYKKNVSSKKKSI